MNENKLSAGKIARLVGNYAWALGMLFIGSFFGGLVSVFLGVFIYGFMTGEDSTPMILALSMSDTSMLGIDGYAASGTSALYSAVMYFTDIGIWIVALLYLRFSKTSRPILKTLTHSTAGNTWANLGLGLLVGFAMNALCVLVALGSGSFSLSFVGFNLVGVLLLFVVVFVQSSAEELLCRCYLYQKTLRTTGSHVATIAITSIAFGLLHIFNNGVTVLAIVNVILVGVLFGLMVWKLDSPWMAFAAHTAWNFTQNILFGLPNSGNTVPFAIFGITSGTTPTSGFAYDSVFGVEGSGIATIVLLAGCALVWFIGNKRNNKPTDIWVGEPNEQNSQAESLPQAPTV
ncbi:MAG: CPBP family intramembrane glutamic endopeptidase [Tractidigestivibacter sp.]|jgi:membrane protease YdiL (CAAX protease family)|uniref:CPBP family intramembrane glutamic endopeptidase n=1 Tax=Tractidigestivibacter sp. TaxID=2847320 RepID=UPI003D93F7C8